MKAGSVVSLLLIFLFVSINCVNCGCIKKEDGISTAFTIPSIKFNEKAIYTTPTYDEKQINETLKVNGCKEENDCFGIRHNCIEIEYNGSRPEGNTRIYIDGDTGAIIQSNNTISKNGEIVGQIWYPTRDEMLWGLNSFPALSIIAMLSTLRETELLQNHEIRLNWYGVNISYTLLGQEDVEYIIEAQYHLTNSMDGSPIDIKEKYWMTQQTLFPLRVDTTVTGIFNSAPITITTATSRIYYTQGTTKISCVCSADHSITHHPLAEFQVFDRCPSDGSKCELDLPLGSAILEACNRSDGFRAYYTEKYPKSYLWQGAYNIPYTKYANISIAKNVSWDLTFVDLDTKATYFISVYNWIPLNNSLLSIISIKDGGESTTDYVPPKRDVFPLEVVSIQSIINIAKPTSSVTPELMGIDWYASATVADGWSYRVRWVEEKGTYPLNPSLYNTFVVFSVTSGALVGWNRNEGAFGG